MITAISCERLMKSEYGVWRNNGNQSSNHSKKQITKKATHQRANPWFFATFLKFLLGCKNSIQILLDWILGLENMWRPLCYRYTCLRWLWRKKRHNTFFWSTVLFFLAAVLQECVADQPVVSLSAQHHHHSCGRRRSKSLNWLSFFAVVIARHLFIHF